MTIFRARIVVDLLYKAEKPLSSPQLTMITNRTGTYLRTGAVEGLEEKIDVLFDEGYGTSTRTTMTHGMSVAVQIYTQQETTSVQSNREGIA